MKLLLKTDFIISSTNKHFAKMATGIDTTHVALSFDVSQDIF